MTFALEQRPVPARDEPLNLLRLGEIGIVTAAPEVGVLPVGDPVTAFPGGVVGLAFRGQGGVVPADRFAGYRFRRLRAGEAATFTGE